MKRPVVVWDGDCGFCRMWIERWKRMTGDRLEYAPFQECDGRFPVPRSAFEKAVHLVEPDGSVTSGAEAVYRMLALGADRRVPLALYRSVPLLRRVSDVGYRFVAGHRRLFSLLTRWLWGRRVTAPSFRLSSWLFVRLVALSFAIAFASFAVQAEGLYGPEGILPVERFLELAAEQLGARRFWAAPTLCWLVGGSLGALKALACAGAACALAAAAGLAAPGLLLLCWALYLSLVTIGMEFMSFQWDILLLEAGLIAACLAPPRWIARPSDPEPPGLARFLALWLLFRLMFQSGAVKLLSGDPTWRGLTALDFHYETQPLPTALAWYAHHLPMGLQRFSCAAMFAIELGLPLLLVAPRRLRLLAFAGLTLLQLLIAATGNYCFFNLLALALCMLLVDDDAWPAAPGWEPRPATGRARGAALGAFALAALLIGALQTYGTLRGWDALPGSARSALGAVAPLRSINNYGLFAVMTTTRNEIVLEGSNDGRTWLPYGFRWKPGDVDRRPGLVAPHQPRLDWQMWFAALAPVERSPWFANLMVRLLQGSKPVLALLEANPFPDAPPKALRAVVYEYHFSDRGSGSAWWKRELRGPFTRELALQ